MTRQELIDYLDKVDDGYGNRSELGLQSLLGAINGNSHSADCSKVRRLEIIDHKTGGTGRVYCARPCRVSLSLQDDDRTLKVFISDPPIGETPYATKVQDS